MLISIGRDIVHRLAVGMGDITGDDFGTIFAKAVDGQHHAKPIGIGDVEWDGCAWSVKTVQGKQNKKSVRLISGRNSPDYSHGISDPRADLNATGHAVLSIWNARIDEALHEFDELRIIVFIRDMAIRTFVLFEEEAQRFIPEDYEWKINKNGNFEGYDKATGDHYFTWQPSGSQFSIYRSVPGSARRFHIVPDVPLVTPEVILSHVKFQPDWIKIDG